MNLDPETINVGYLAAWAYDWDKDGPSTAPEALDALSFELRGSKQKDAVGDLLSRLGKRPNDESDSARER
jgi:hypothetical protein